MKYLLSITTGLVDTLAAAIELSSSFSKFSKSVSTVLQQTRIIIAGFSDTIGILSHL